MFSLLHSGSVQMKNSTRSISAIAIWKIQVISIANEQHSHRECYSQLTPCVVSEKNWITKEDKGKSMMCILFILPLAKRHISKAHLGTK